ncbi:MAG: hypothetical protein SGI99_15595 [Pseudomonadota bacterium]|nr:hypothetical protein [Pseudomonadota bacterium]
MSHKRIHLLATSLVFCTGIATAQTATFLGPTPYLQQSDTPAGLSALPVVLENLEDNVRDPDLSTAAGIIASGLTPIR